MSHPKVDLKGTAGFVFRSPQNYSYEPGHIIFYNTDAVEMLRFCPGNGNVYVRGRLAETDKEIADGVRQAMHAFRGSK